jgi:uncharacterized protein
MVSFISQAWPWYVSGPMISLVMFLLLFVGREFGVSSTLRTGCAILGAGKNVSFFKFDWKSQIWNLVFIGGAVIGGFIASTVFANPEPLTISEATVTDLAALNIEFNGGLAPESLFSWKSLTSVYGIITLVLGGFLVGFGSRWAGGCTSGHAISGLSNLQLPSLIAVIGFFIGGLTMTHLLFPFLFKNFDPALAWLSSIFN